MPRLTAIERKAIADTLKADIDAFCAWKMAEETPRRHIGASEMGHECLRKLVYSFRWMYHEEFDGRMRRLFDRGYKEEDRFAEWLRGIGAKLATHDAVTGKQIRIGDDKLGHYGGSLDGIIELPERYGLPFPMLCEMKTHSKNSFYKLKKEGVEKSKPLHFYQMCQYGYHRGLQYGVYIATNKDDDDIYVELVEHDMARGAELERKAGRVVGAKSLPDRIASSPAYASCKFCPAVAICHLDRPAIKNCRSCQFSDPASAGRWKCRVWNAIIPNDEIPKGCGSWKQFE
jgi:hypothetical protein